MRQFVHMRKSSGALHCVYQEGGAEVLCSTKSKPGHLIGAQNSVLGAVVLKKRKEEGKVSTAGPG